jgi:HEAT repeat protein
MSDETVALDILKERLGSGDEESRRAAVAPLAGYRLDDVKDLLYAAMGDDSWRIRKEALDVLVSFDLDEQVMEELVGLLRASDNAGLRNSACEALERLGESCLPVVSSHISDTDPDVRKYVVDVLGTIGDPVSIPLLVGALDDPDFNVSIAAAENLGKIGDESVVDDLVKALDRNNIQRCYTVLEALGKIGRQVPLELLVPLYEEVLLKKPVIDCIGAVGDIKAVPLLVAGFRENARHLRSAAANALIKIRQSLPEDISAERVDGFLREMSGTPFIDELIASLGLADRNLSEPIVKILGIIGDSRAALVLLEGCRNDRLRGYCLDALRRIGLPAVRALIDSYASADDEHRCYIIHVCGELRVAESAGLIRNAMHDPNHVIRRIAAIAAGSIGDVLLVPDLGLLVDDAELDVRTSAVEALAVMAGMPESASLVVEIASFLASDPVAEKRRNSAKLYAALRDTDRLALLIKDENATVRKAAVYSMAELKSASSINHLVMALVDEEPEVRMSAAGALGSLGGKQAIKALLVAMSDSNQWVKCAALRSLGMLRVTEAETPILAMVETEDGLVLIAALKALFEINSEKALQLAVTLLNHDDKEVVKAALEILSHRDGSWLEENCQRLLSHGSWDIRSLFIRVLVDHLGKEAVPLLRKALKNESDDLVRKQIADFIGDLS